MKVYLQTSASDIEVHQSQINILEWLAERLSQEMDRKWPHGPITVLREYDYKRYRTTVAVVAEWKEPVQ